VTNTDPLAQVSALGRRYKRLVADLAALRPQLTEAIRAAAPSVAQVDLVRESGYTRETVRQICLPDEERAVLAARRRKAVQ
jgi:hypothetical protein